MKCQLKMDCFFGESAWYFLTPCEATSSAESLLGIAKCQERARQGEWWPGLLAQLEQLTKNCQECCKAQNQGAKQLLPSPLPDLPLQKVGTDLFKWDSKTYLVVFSQFIQISKLTGSTTEVIDHTKSIFAKHGIPEVVISDNGPQYASQFAWEYGSSHATISPLYPQGNGEAEEAVRTVEELRTLHIEPHLYSAAIVHQSCLHPANCPTTRQFLIPVVPDKDKLREKDEHRQEHNFKNNHRASSLPPLIQGTEYGSQTRILS